MIEIWDAVADVFFKCIVFPCTVQTLCDIVSSCILFILLLLRLWASPASSAQGIRHCTGSNCWRKRTNPLRMMRRRDLTWSICVCLECGKYQVPSSSLFIVYYTVSPAWKATKKRMSAYPLLLFSKDGGNQTQFNSSRNWISYFNPHIMWLTSYYVDTWNVVVFWPDVSNMNGPSFNDEVVFDTINISNYARISNSATSEQMLRECWNSVFLQ